MGTSGQEHHCPVYSLSFPCFMLLRQTFKLVAGNLSEIRNMTDEREARSLGPGLLATHTIGLFFGQLPVPTVEGEGSASAFFPPPATEIFL